MNWDAIGAIGQMLGSVAVLVTLAYVAMQLRQADRNQRGLMNQGVINRGSEDIAFLAQPHVIEVTSRVLAGETDFTAIEVRQLSLVMRKIILGAQDAYVQHKAALTDQVTFDNALGALRFYMCQPVYRALWKANRAFLADEWASFVDTLIESIPLAVPNDQVAQFNAELAKIRR